MSDKNGLIDFAKNLKWEEHLDNPIVYSSLEKIRDAVNNKSTIKTNAKEEDMDMSGAKRVKLVVVGDGCW